jgi:hypothetical protein
MVVFTFFVSLIVFPGVISRIPSESEDPQLWFPVLLIVPTLSFAYLSHQGHCFVCKLTVFFTVYLQPWRLHWKDGFKISSTGQSDLLIKSCFCFSLTHRCSSSTDLLLHLSCTSPASFASYSFHWFSFASTGVSSLPTSPPTFF